MDYQTNPWFVCPKPSSQARMRLYCFPYAGGGIPVFRTWPDGLPGVEIWVAHLPGRGSRFGEEPRTSMLALVQALGRGLPVHSPSASSGQAEQPFAFFGHSLGARVSFELARSLRRQGKPLPAHLLVSACPAPQIPHGRPLHTLPKAAFLAELERRNGIPEEVLAQSELLDLLLPVLRADLTVDETAVYSSEPPLECPITAFGGMEDPLVSREALAAWGEQAAGPFRMSFFAGDHFFLRTAETQLLQAVERALAFKAAGQ